MRGLLDVYQVDLVVARDGFSETAGCPGVKLTVAEDDVRNRQEVTLDVFSAKVVPHPLVSWGHLVFLLTILGEGVVVEGLGDEHGVISIGAGHRELVASENVPAETVKATGGISVGEVCAVGVGGVIVEVDVHCLEHGAEDLLLTRAELPDFLLMMLFFSGGLRTVEVLAGNIDRPCGHGIKE